jgi:hypothetical protein
MKSWNYDAPKMALDVRVDYFVSLFGPDGTEIYETRRIHPAEIRSLRADRANLATTGFRTKAERRVTTRWVEACHYCQARPCITEWDCDGPYMRVICDDPQCNRGANLDNSDWVAGKGPLWGPEHPEWQATAA